MGVGPITPEVEHLADTVDAHDASAISFSATGTISSTDVQAAIAELDSEKAAVAEPIAAAHISDTSDAHDASAISVLDAAGNYTATDVEAVLAELPSRYGRLGQVRGGSYVVVGESESELSAAWHFLLGIQSGGELVKSNHVYTNYATTSVTTTFLAANMTPLLTPRPNIVILACGRNDADQGVTFTTTKANIRSMVAQAQAVGAQVVLCTPMPRSSTDSTSSATTAAVALLARWIKNYAAYNGLPVIDFHSLLIDPTNGKLKSAYAQANQNITMAGHAAMATEALRVLRLPTSSIAQNLSYEGDPGNLIVNGSTLTDSNSDGLPDGWTTFSLSPATLSVVTDTRFISGKAIQITQTGSTNSPEVQRAISTPTTAVSPGDSVGLTCSFTIETATGVPTTAEGGPGFAVYGKWPSSNPFLSYFNLVTAADKINKLCGLMYWPLVSPSPATSWDRTTVGVLFRLLGMTVGSTVTARFGDVAMFNYTKEGSAENGWAIGALSWANAVGCVAPYGT